MADDDDLDLSRRNFLKTGAASALTAGVAPAALIASTAASVGEIAGPGAVPVRLEVNGVTRTLSVEPRVTLLDALRDALDLTGAKRVCDRGTCGACTVLVDGSPAYACSVLAIDAQGRKIATVEGLGGAAGALHPLQAAFVEHDAQQCGFCTPGFVMAAKALIDRDPNPTDAAIDRALGGNVCRCGTYAGMRRAVRSGAAAMRKG